jgi:hypothetical protein
VTTSQATVVQPASILNRRTLNTEQGATIPFYKVFTKEKIIFIFLGKCVFILLQGFRPLILLKTKDRCTSLMVIGVMKIMCNKNWERNVFKVVFYGSNSLLNMTPFHSLCVRVGKIILSLDHTPL